MISSYRLQVATIPASKSSKTSRLSPFTWRLTSGGGACSKCVVSNLAAESLTETKFWREASPNFDSSAMSWDFFKHIYLRSSSCRSSASWSHLHMHVTKKVASQVFPLTFSPSVSPAWWCSSLIRDVGSVQRGRRSWDTSGSHQRGLWRCTCEARGASGRLPQ